MEKEREPMTLIEAAAIAKVKPVTLWAAIKRKKLRGTQRGGVWFVTHSDLKDWQTNKPHKAGRPRRT